MTPAGDGQTVSVAILFYRAVIYFYAIVRLESSRAVVPDYLGLRLR